MEKKGGIFPCALENCLLQRQLPYWCQRYLSCRFPLITGITGRRQRLTQVVRFARWKGARKKGIIFMMMCTIAVTPMRTVTVTVPAVTVTVPADTAPEPIPAMAAAEDIIVIAEPILSMQNGSSEDKIYYIRNKKMLIT